MQKIVVVVVALFGPWSMWPREQVLPPAAAQKSVTVKMWKVPRIYLEAVPHTSIFNVGQQPTWGVAMRAGASPTYKGEREGRVGVTTFVKAETYRALKVRAAQSGLLMKEVCEQALTVAALGAVDASPPGEDRAA